MSKPTEVATTETAALVLDADQARWTPQQLTALHAMGVSEQASEAELDIFLHVSKRSMLDPFSRQIYLVSRKDRALVDGQWVDAWKSTIQTGIDGYRVIARRAADRAGVDLEYEDTLWCGQDGVWVDAWLDAGPPSAAKTTILRGGHRFSAVALFREYAQTKRKQNDEIVLTGMWATRGAGQLAKCSEALCLRKAFPLDLSNIYTDDEMAQADNPEGATVVAGAVVRDEPDPDAGTIGDARPRPREPFTEQPRGNTPRSNVVRLLDEHGYATADDRRARITQILGRDVDSLADLNAADFETVIAELEVEPIPTEGSDGDA